MTRLVPDISSLPQATSNETVALVSFEVFCGSMRGFMQLCIPWRHVAQTPQAMASGGGSVSRRHPVEAVKVPLVAAARVARLQDVGERTGEFKPWRCPAH